MAKRINDTEERKRQILMEATRLFTQKGYQGVGIDEIADSCGIVRGTVLRYFGSKEELYRQVLFPVGNTAGAYLASISEDETIPATVALRRLIELAVQQFQKVRGLAADYLEDPMTRHNFDVIRLPEYYQLADCMERLLERGKRDGCFDIENTRIRAYSVIFAVFGITGSLEDTSKMQEEMYELVERMLGIERKERT